MKKRGIFLPLLAMTVCVSCGGRLKKPVSEAVVTLDWYVNFSWYTGGWGTDSVSGKITEDTGTAVNFITPSGNEAEKLGSLITSGSLPDLITLSWSDPQVSEMIGNDMVYAWNSLAEQYDTSFRQVSDPDAVDWYTEKDGNIYCYPSSFYRPGDLKNYDNVSSNETFLVRKDIYRAIGSPDMTTKKGFMDAVREAAKVFPEVDGMPLIPVGAHVFDNAGCVSFDKYLQDFLAVPYEKEGRYYDRGLDPEYIGWLKAFRQLGEEGYLLPDIFVDTKIQMDEKLKQGRYFCMIYQYSDLLSQLKRLVAKSPDRVYIAVDGPGNSNGSDPALPVPGMNGWTVTMISKDCRDPERAIRLMEYMLSEKGKMILHLGLEGETYELRDGSPVIYPEAVSMLNTDREEFDRVYGADYRYWMLQDSEIQLRWPWKLPDYVMQLKEWSYPYVIYSGQYERILALDPDEEEAAGADDRINKLWGRTLPELLLASSEDEFQDILDGFVQKREELGFQELQEAKTRLMRESKKKLGLE